MDLSTLILGGAGGTVATAVIAVVVANLSKAREKKRDDAELAVEQHAKEKFDRLEKTVADGFARVESTVGQTQDSQRRSEGEMRGVNSKIDTLVATLSAVDSRVSGISADYGPRLKALELRAEREDAKKEALAEFQAMSPRRTNPKKRKKVTP